MQIAGQVFKLECGERPDAGAGAGCRKAGTGGRGEKEELRFTREVAAIMVAVECRIPEKERV